MTEQITKTHIFGECDLDLSKSAKQVWKELFNISEACGYFPSQESYGFEVVDRDEISYRFKVQKINDEYFVTKVKRFGPGINEDVWSRT